ncbi:MAG: DNA topoisomerase [Candidatus Hodarchaeota archaeon]
MALRVLVIGEKTSQVKTFTKFLMGQSKAVQEASRIYSYRGNWTNSAGQEFNFVFLPLSGHITNIDTGKGYGWTECEPVEIVSSKKALFIKENYNYRRVIEDLATVADEMWLATDPDSEGDNIAYEAYCMAQRVREDIMVRRIWNSSLTKKEVLRAFNNPRSPWDERLALAVQGRRYADAWLGFAGTREVTKTARTKMKVKVVSVGRVQMPTLKLIVDRDRERESFKPEPRWKILADLVKEEEKFQAGHEHNPFKEQAAVDKVIKVLGAPKEAKVLDISKEEQKKQPPIPLNTTSAISLICGLTKLKAAEALKYMATLYQEGYLSYPRTDNTKFKDDYPHKPILDALEKHPTLATLIQQVKDRTKIRVNGKARGAEDHDPIHPTGEIPMIGKGSIRQIHTKVWSILARHHIGGFMDDLRSDKTEIWFDIQTERFISQGSVVLDPGWTQAIYWAQEKDSLLPSLKTGEIVPVDEIKVEKSQTKPKPRWTDKTLPKELERLQIGTKSSRSDIIDKLEKRKYIERVKTSYTSTELGRTMIELLEPIWSDVLSPVFTRHVEELMDNVANGKASYKDMLTDLRTEYLDLHQILINNLPKFHQILEKTRATFKTPTRTKSRKSTKSTASTVKTCPSCGEGSVVERQNKKTGNSFLGCSRYPHCKWTQAISAIPDEKSIIGKCPYPDCTGDFVLKNVKDFRLAGCTNYPQCQHAYFLPKEGSLKVLKSKKCPNCKQRLIRYTQKAADSKKRSRKLICPTCRKFVTE